MNKFRHIIPAALAATLISCVNTMMTFQSTTASSPPPRATVAMLPMDILINMRTAGGVLEPRVDWSERVSERLEQAARAHFYQRGVRLIPYRSDALLDRHVDLARRTNTALDAVQLALAYRALPSHSIPESEREYSLSGYERLRAEYNADYALYISLRANLASSGREVLALLAAMGGIPMQISDAIYRVALFDLRDGKLLYANLDPGARIDVDDSDEDWLEFAQEMLTEFPL